MRISHHTGRSLPFARLAGLAALGISLALFSATAGAQEMHHHHGSDSTAAAADGATSAAPPVFVASTAKSFAALMDDAMLVMDDGMKRAPMNGQSEHDFVTMMMPHHQGAVDMAKAVLLYTKDPEIRNLALGIIAEQQNEIHVMQAWLTHHPEAGAKK
ncbi:DUF305 domain-containing protein [Undibacterium sp.]|uniref:DUF305 domain-containing protein n=1 Tax=Undibacterium sp. TaxID=1914977 RepID=UPI00374D654C